MTTFQPTAPKLPLSLPAFRLSEYIRKVLLQEKTKRALLQLSTEQLKDIGRYRETKILSSTLNRQLW